MCGVSAKRVRPLERRGDAVAFTALIRVSCSMVMRKWCVLNVLIFAFNIVYFIVSLSDLFLNDGYI